MSRAIPRSLEGKRQVPRIGYGRSDSRRSTTCFPALIPAGAPDIVSEWNHRKPAAIASFLQGEAAFRRLHLADALKHYRAAVKADSLFGLAAVRGAQAAVWSHRPEEAASLIDVAARQTMPPRYAHFTRGYQLYLAGEADSAAAEFRKAIELDPEMTVAWIQLGEVYTHLLPERGDPISLAAAALEEAHRLDPDATTLLLHLIENRLRKREIAQAQPLVRRFLAADPEPELAQQVRVMEACVEKGPDAVDWGKEAAQHSSGARRGKTVGGGRSAARLRDRGILGGHSRRYHRPE